jgi:plastocyanin
MKKTLTLLALLAALGAVLLVTASPGTAVTARAAAVKKVAVKDDFFGPTKVTIRKGSTVKWVWRGFNVHNVHVAGKKSGDKFSGSYTHRFLHKGKFKVICTIHEDVGMKMTVTVK